MALREESLKEDLAAAAEALVHLRLICGAAGKINEADAHLASLGFAYPFTGYRNPVQLGD